MCITVIVNVYMYDSNSKNGIYRMSQFIQLLSLEFISQYLINLTFSFSFGLKSLIHECINSFYIYKNKKKLT